MFDLRPIFYPTIVSEIPVVYAWVETGAVYFPEGIVGWVEATGFVNPTALLNSPPSLIVSVVLEAAAAEVDVGYWGAAEVFAF